jgi:transcriptional regulator with XRE-family HTH domain
MDNRFKDLRERLGYKTQTALAEVLVIEPSNVSKWEAGNGYPSYEFLRKFLELGATVEELFGVEYNKVAAPVVEPTMLAGLPDDVVLRIVERGLGLMLRQN